MENGTEHKALLMMGFTCFESPFHKQIIAAAEELDLARFMQGKLGIAPTRMIFCTEEYVEGIKPLLKKGEELWINCKDRSKLAHLDEFPEAVLVVTKPELMRCWDYRARANPMWLLVARDFPHERAMCQAFGRVGRYDEAGLRLKLPNLNLINREQKSVYLNTLLALIA